MKLPAGRYYIGDPCYVIANNRWNEVCDQLFAHDRGNRNDPIVTGITLDGITFWMHTTAYGDGGYPDHDGRVYSVDSGTIGIVPEVLIKQGDYRGLGHLIEFTQPIEASYDEGTFHFDSGRNSITIETDPEVEDFDDEDEDDEDEDDFDDEDFWDEDDFDEEE